MDKFDTHQQMNPIAKKLNRILSSKIETDQDLVDSLETVSSFFVENDANQRRNLRRDLELRCLKTNVCFLDSFKKVKTSVDAVALEVEKMGNCCETMTKRLASTQQQTRDLLNRTTVLQNQRKIVEKQVEIVSAFLTTFQLKADELKALKDGPNRQFFSALARVREIHQDCKQLLQTNHNTAALEIMEDMAQCQESAYELLYRWIQHECRLLSADLADVNPLLCQAFEAMQQREVLFSYSLDEYANSRRNVTVRAFIDALTRGGHGGVPKPIELLSHDPLRYITDMLGWIHQSMASEKETLQNLLKLCKNQFYESENISVISRIFEGLCRPFKIRVEQALSSENQPVSLYRLSNLFTFYSNTMSPSLLEDATLIKTMTDLKELTLNMFFSGLNIGVHKLLEKIVPPDDDLLPVQGVHQILLLLRDVLESHDSALATVTDKKDNFAKIFATVLDPLNQSLLLSATRLAPLEVAVYLLNCLSSIHSVISLYQYTDDRLESLLAQMEANEDVLVSEQATSILNRTSMLNIYNKSAAHLPKMGPLSKFDEMKPQIVSSSLSRFDLFLSKPDNYRIPQGSLLTSIKIRENVQKRTVENIIAAYGIIHRQLVDSANEYPHFGIKNIEQVINFVQLLL